MENQAKLSFQLWLPGCLQSCYSFAAPAGATSKYSVYDFIRLKMMMITGFFAQSSKTGETMGTMRTEEVEEKSENENY